MGERQTSREPRLPEAQIIEDFRHLQLLNNQVRESTVQQGARQKGLIKPLGKIRKRAKRLKANLVLTGGGDQEATSELGSDVGLEALLRRLDQSIKSFVRNPMFHSTKVVDLGLARSARLDLERVIELSGMIADRIRKEVR